MRTQLIPPGLCQCGCGQATTTSAKNDTSKGWVKGEPLRWKRGHRKGPMRDRKPNRYVVEDRGHETPCWIWQLSGSHGYGRDRDRNAHRAVYEQRRGPVPAGLQLDHLCRVRACVNPDHMEPVTNAENSRRGAKAKLTHAVVDEMKRLREQGLGYRVIGERFGVAENTARSAIVGISWADPSR